ncbi:hypothetical protein [Acidianus ambivalens]|uniref:Uncharacterized protein n=1 Tax=Acidianus ambivalens TaxID=2283 RepID=A0A650CXF4_ACIAM|nr:hypothetical protein [Acidianus ambivalens]MQL54678.1 hypothetical protein [Acidianus ambivalens]QGR22478.1 hypothetical protein D1866_11215 [Acidianus ambivalens]
MNDSDTQVNIALTHFETLIEDHSTYLNELENLSVIPQMDMDRVMRIIKRMRKIRKDLELGINTILTHIDSVGNSRIKEEAIGIISYLNIVGFKDEKEILQKLSTQAKEIGYDINIDDDIKQIDNILSKISKISL